MKKSLLFFYSLAMAALTVNGREFVNLDFESCSITNVEVSVPGWRSSNGSDTGFRVGSTHLGMTQWHRVVQSFSPQGGSHAMAFASGLFKSNLEHAPWIQAYIAQTGWIPRDAAFVQLLAQGEFKVLMEGVEVPMVAIGNDLYHGDVRGFAGGIAELKIVNMAQAPHRPLKVDNISFAPWVSSEVWWQHTNGSLARWEIGAWAGGGQAGSSTLYSSTRLSNSFGSGWKAFARTDFNGDESSDILFQNDAGLLGVQLMTNNSVLGIVTIPNDLPAHHWRLFSAADINNDRAPDLLFQHRVNGRLAVRLMDGTNFLSPTVVTNGHATQGVRALAANDFNNDDVTDILLQDKSRRLVVWLGPDFVSTVFLRDGRPLGAEWSVGGVADRLLTDGTSGILFHHADGRVGLWRMNGTTYLEPILLPRSVGPAWSMVGAR